MSKRGQHRRYHAFDTLRAGMMLLGVVFHATLPYITVPWFFGDPSTHPAFDYAAAFLHAFRMPVFFVMAGFFGALLCERRGVAGLLRNRVRRIVLPFVAAYLVIGPLATGASLFAVEVMQLGSVREALARTAPLDWLRWNEIHHLWFLAVLIVFYPLAVGLEWVLARTSAGLRGPLTRALRGALASPWRAAFLALAAGALFLAASLAHGLLALQVALLLLALFVFFGFGWLLYRWADLLPRLEQRAWLPLLVALAALPYLTWTLRAAAAGSENIPPVAALYLSVVSAGMICGLIGLFLKCLERPWPAARYVSDASYWIYLAHFPLVIALEGALIPLALPAGVKFLLVLAIAIPLLLASYHFGVRYTAIGLFLNGKRHERPMRAR